MTESGPTTDPERLAEIFTTVTDDTVITDNQDEDGEKKVSDETEPANATD